MGKLCCSWMTAAGAAHLRRPTVGRQRRLLELHTVRRNPALRSVVEVGESKDPRSPSGLALWVAVLDCGHFRLYREARGQRPPKHRAFCRYCSREAHGHSTRR